MSASWGAARFTPRGSGSSEWLELVNVDLSTEDDQLPSSSQLTFGGVVWTVEGSANDTEGGPQILSGVLRIAPDIATNIARSSASKRSAPILHSTLSNLGAAFSILDYRQLAISIEVAGWSPSATQEAIRIGMETAANPLGSGASGRGVMGGVAYSSTIRAGALVYQDSTGTGSSESTATLSSVASLACVFCGAGVTVFSANVANTFDSIEKILAGSPRISGGARGSTTYQGRDRLLITAESPDASSGPVLTISSLKIWARE